MTEIKLKEGNSFIVRESLLIDFLFGGIFFALFAGIIVSMHFSLSFAWLSYPEIFFTTLLPAAAFLVKGIRNKVIVKINNSGIFYRGSLVTSWENFIGAYLVEEEVTGSLSDNFRIAVEYYLPANNMNYLQKLDIGARRTNRKNR